MCCLSNDFFGFVAYKLLAHLEYDVSIMPSWNIHTAHVERLLSDRSPERLGITDANAFLFGNYVPDIYVGFMVSDITYRINYCLTHMAVPETIPIPDADRFWDDYLSRRKPKTDAGLSLTLGAWAHLVADRFYNASFHEFYATHDTPEGEELRKRKQADFALFGSSLGISSHVQATPELIEAARDFRPYSVLPADVERSIEAASAIVRAKEPLDCNHYQLLSAEWMFGVFEACNEWLIAWLEAVLRIESRNECASSAQVRAEAGLKS